jgi:hypothetical protein
MMGECRKKHPSAASPAIAVPFLRGVHAGQSMIDEGVPAGIKWLIALGAALPRSGGR